MVGNITSRTGVGTYTYLAATQALPHAVLGVSGTVNGTSNPSYSYDLNGNLIIGAGRSVAWTSFNMVDQIVQGTTTISYAYSCEHARISQIDVPPARTPPTSSVRKVR